MIKINTDLDHTPLATTDSELRNHMKLNVYQCRTVSESDVRHDAECRSLSVQFGDVKTLILPKACT